MNRKEAIQKLAEQENIKKESNDFLNYTEVKGELRPTGVNIDKVAKHLISQKEFKTIFGTKGEDIYVFNGKFYESEGRAVIENETEKLLEGWAKNNVVAEVLRKVKRLTKIDRDVFEQTPLNLIPFENGTYNIQKDEFMPHDPKNYFTSIIPTAFVRTSKCPKFDKFLSETLYQDDIAVIQEWFGFCLYRRYFVKKGMIFVGEQDTGKTLLLNILTRFIGKNNATGLSLQKISSSSMFHLYSLYKKHLNVYDDLSSKDLSDGGGFKIVTGGGDITAEQKFGDVFKFTNFAKMLFACNKIPPIKDNDDHAYYSRWMPVEFANKPDKKDPFLIDKLTTDEELSGILNWAIEGLKRLLENGKFSYEKSEEEVKRIMDSGNLLLRFVDECLIEDPDGKITKDQMFDLFSLWAKEMKVSRLSKTQLGRDLEKNCRYISDKRESTRYWAGASFNVEKLQSMCNLDTLDTFFNTYKEYWKKENSKYNDIMVEKNPSKVSDRNNDRLDTFLSEDDDFVKPTPIKINSEEATS